MPTPRSTPRPGPRTLLVGLLLGAVLSACGGPSGDDPDAAPPATPPATSDSAAASSPEPSGPSETGDPSSAGAMRYVALGDSYAAAPGVPQTDAAAGCFRSDHNYPSLLAASIGAEMTDVSCSGATSDDITAPQYDGVPAQVDALSADTDLVTIGIGGNDEGLFTRLFTACARLGATTAGPGDSPCADEFAEQSDAALASIEQSVDAAVGSVVSAAPAARVVVVGYPAIVPASGTCERLSPLSAADSGYLRGVNRALDDALRDAAEAHDADYVDVFRASRGHDVCSDDPWVNGNQAAPDGTIPLHPLLAGTRGVAAAVAAAL